MEINKIYNENCLDTMAKMPDKFVDLVVTSPPYDGLRTYNGYSFPFEEIAKELGVEKEEIAASLDAIQDPVSLQEPVYNDGTENIFVMDQVKDKKNTDEYTS